MDENLKDLMQELGNAINESLSESDRIGSAIEAIKSAGYDVFLLLDFTIGFKKRNQQDEANEDGEIKTKPRRRRPFETKGKITLTTQDQKFLRALKISIDDDTKK